MRETNAPPDPVRAYLAGIGAAGGRSRSDAKRAAGKKNAAHALATRWANYRAAQQATGADQAPQDAPTPTPARPEQPAAPAWLTPQTDLDALTLALYLGLTAPTDALMHACAVQADGFAARLSAHEVSRAKRAATAYWEAMTS